MTGNTKRGILNLLGLVMITTMMIAASLPQLELQPGMPSPRLQGGQVVVAPTKENPFVAISVNTFVVVLLALMLTGATLYSLYKLVRGADWKRILESLRSMLIISLVLSGLVFLIILLPRSSIIAPIEIPASTPEPIVTSPLGSVPPFLLWLVGIALLIISVTVGVWLFTSARQRTPIDLVGLEAEKAWQALKTGSDLKNVIVKCYLQMSMALEQEQGIERQDFMTTGEFEKLLQAAGIPHEPIHQLTRLFDAVRYGNWQPNTADEQNAIQSLEAIMLYSRQSKATN
jgi:hypothetical protein